LFFCHINIKVIIKKIEIYIDYKVYILKMEECAICYESIGEINVSITICKHKFHTNCLIKCGNVCPMCRTNVSSFTLNSSVSRIPVGIYNMSEYIQELKQNNISIDDIPLQVKQWIEDCKEHDKIKKEIEEEKRQKEEKYKNNLKKTDIKKYDLFYS
jgi:hypothetical protein